MHMTTINTYWAVVANASHKNELGDQITRRGGIATGGKHFIFCLVIIIYLMHFVSIFLWKMLRRFVASIFVK